MSVDISRAAIIGQAANGRRDGRHRLDARHRHKLAMDDRATGAESRRSNALVTKTRKQQLYPNAQSGDRIDGYR